MFRICSHEPALSCAFSNIADAPPNPACAVQSNLTSCLIVTQWLWAFSIYLEAVAIIPQLFMLQKIGFCENITSHYVFVLGMYRFFYLLNWVYRYFHEYHYSQIIVWVCGVVQTALYCDFFVNYFQSKKGGINKTVKLGLPV